MTPFFLNLIFLLILNTKRNHMESKPNGKHVTEAPGSDLLKMHRRERSSAHDFMRYS